MIEPVFGQNDAVGRFVGSFIPGGERGFGNCTTLGFARDGVLVAGIVYHNWNPEAGVIEISAGATRRDWTSRKVVRAIFEYPFGQVGCQAVVARISAHNKRARRIWRALGASEHVLPRLRGPNEGEVVAIITKEDWEAGPYSKEVKHGKI